MELRGKRGMLVIEILKPVDMKYNHLPMLRFERQFQTENGVELRKVKGWYYYPEREHQFREYLKKEGFDDESIDYIVNIVKLVSEFY